MTKSDDTHKPSAFESEKKKKKKSEIYTLCISPLQGAALTNAVAFVVMPDTAMGS